MDELTWLRLTLTAGVPLVLKQKRACPVCMTEWWGGESRQCPKCHPPEDTNTNYREEMEDALFNG